MNIKGIKELIESCNILEWVENEEIIFQQNPIGIHNKNIKFENNKKPHELQLTTEVDK